MDLLTNAKAVAEHVETEATKAKVPVAVCVIDVHGNLVLQHRMNGAPVFSLEISERKAYTAALVGVRTADLLALVQPGQSLYALPTVGRGRFCPMGGGAPLLDDDRLFVGVSGRTAEQDVAIMETALKQLVEQAAGSARESEREASLAQAQMPS